MIDGGGCGCVGDGGCCGGSVHSSVQKATTVERRLSERQSSETSNIRTNILFVLLSNNEKSTITSRNKVLCHFY